VIGAGSVVTKDLNFPGIYFGNPAHLKTNND
jgi:acetyltransferase-like isoleucine patch superfamily enzyme